MGTEEAPRRVLVIERFAKISFAYSEKLKEGGYSPIVVETAAEAQKVLASTDGIVAILLDLHLPDAEGIELLKAHPEILALFPVIIATSDKTTSRAIEAMRLGAFEYLVKPAARTRLIAAIDSATTSRSGFANLTIDKRSPIVFAGSRFVGGSPQMQAIYRQISLVANSRATVLITGETGTGKEICAETLHQQSSRASRPFVVINCGAIPENLIESELFGHLKGSFTGAVDHRDGAAQAAHGGTLFLDEICEMPLHLQVKLLRFLQSGTVKRIGSNRMETVDVRVICATNRNPATEVAEGRLREDLYYRIAVVPIEMPPLRLRSGDIPELAGVLLRRFAREAGKTFHPLTPAHVALLEAEDWPGNVRELENLIWRATLLNEGPDLPLAAFAPDSGSGMVLQNDDTGRAAGPHPEKEALAGLDGMSFAEIERLVIERAIATHSGHVPLAAQSLGLSASTLYRKLKEW
ncbi:hypothetical protein AQZ52_07935 [Novosphingobium fuchskuhlense]|uniref:AAA family ATPase n=1 Tax=Novosphingobium fuchskuhlense TaxID=1117702 RepID=A0A117UW82_9SPHN|nr:sigma-54 dependent transcriptional regulator [Novosphingobium fuchskuhlense]KUR71965.1 hypothetical protein AQZ52_07935 [Novosphingobium fuchskuhlense]